MIAAPDAGFSATSGLTGAAWGLAGAALIVTALWSVGRRVIALGIARGIARGVVRATPAGLEPGAPKALDVPESLGGPKALGAPEALLLGAGIFSQGVFLLAGFGAWSPLFGIVCVLVGAVTGARGLGSIPWRRVADAWPAFPAALALAATLLAPTVFWDSRAYHLAIPEFVALRGALVDDPGFVYAWYPQAMESLYALCVPFGDASARLLNAAFLAAAAAVAARSARSPLAAALLLATPAFLLLAYAPKNSGLLALAGALSFEQALLAGTARARTAPDAADDPGSSGPGTRARAAADDAGATSGPTPVSAATAAGIAAGIALATHYAAIWHLVLLVPIVAARGGARALARFLLGAALFAAPTYLRNLAATGNPVYPFLPSLFGTAPPASIHAGALPSIGTIAERLLVLPWTGIESLGIGSTLGILLPAGVLLAWLSRRERPVPDLATRAGFGFGLLAVAASLYGFVRFGIAGLVVLAPIAAVGLEKWRRPAEWACTGYALAGAILLIAGPFDPLAAHRFGADAYRARYDAAWPLAVVARTLPPEARIASAGILRSQGWGARLDAACEDFPPPLERHVRAALGDGSAGARADTGGAEVLARSLRAAGYTHIAVDEQEIVRLRRQYGHLAWGEDGERLFRALLADARPILGTPRGASLYEIP